MDVHAGVRDLLDRKGRTVHTIDREASLIDCASEMLDKEVGSLIVCDNGDTLAGIVTYNDVLRSVAKPDPKLNTTKVGDVMATSVATASEDDDFKTVERLMVNKGIRHLPVLADGKVVGIITRVDVLRAHLTDADALSNDLEAYITGVYPSS